MIVLMSLKSRFTQAGLRDDLGNAFNGPHEHVVRHLECRVQGKTRDQFQEFVIRDHHHRVREAAEFLQAVLGVSPLGSRFARNGNVADCNREGSSFLRELARGRSSPGPRAPAEAARDEHHVCAVDDVRSSSAASRADSSPTWGRATRPEASVTRRPRSSLWGDRMINRCWASVFAAYSSAPTMPDSTRRSIVLQPPPPIPTIFMFVRRLARIRSSSASSAPTPIDWVGDSGAGLGAPIG